MVLPIGLTLVPLILLLGRQILPQVTKEGVCQTRIRGWISSTIETGTRTEVYRNRYQARWSNDSDNGLIKDLRMSKGWRKFRIQSYKTIQPDRLVIIRVIAWIRSILFCLGWCLTEKPIRNRLVTITLKQKREQYGTQEFY